ARLGGIDVAQLLRIQAEIIDHRPGTAGRIARAEIAVDVVLAEPGILDRALGDLRMELRGGFVRRMPGRVLIDPGNVVLALDGQNTALRWRFFLQGFSDAPGRYWQARKYSVAREGSRWTQVHRTLVSRTRCNAPALLRRAGTHAATRIIATWAPALQRAASGRCFASPGKRCATSGARELRSGKIVKVICPTTQAISFFSKSIPFSRNQPHAK